MNVKGRGGYVGKDGVPRLNVLDVQKQIRSPETRHRGREWFRYRRQTRIARGLRPYDRFRERYLRTDWSSCG